LLSKKFKIVLEKKHGRNYLNGVLVRDTDTFCYFLKRKGWQGRFKTLPKLLAHMEKQDQKLVEKFVQIDFNDRVTRGERVELQRAKRSIKIE
jgi:hypothetical protein